MKRNESKDEIMIEGVNAMQDLDSMLQACEEEVPVTCDDGRNDFFHFWAAKGFEHGECNLVKQQIRRR